MKTQLVETFGVQERIPSIAEKTDFAQAKYRKVRMPCPVKDIGAYNHIKKELDA